MFNKTDFIKGMSPWTLKDFKSTRRHQPRVQDFWNVKGLITYKCDKQRAYYILKNFYETN